MKSQPSSRTKLLLEVGQLAAESMIKEPVKEAVKEALVEERVAGDEWTERSQQSMERESKKTGRRFPSRRVLIPLAGVGALAIYAKRRGMSLPDLRNLGGRGDSSQHQSTGFGEKASGQSREARTHSSSRSSTGGGSASRSSHSGGSSSRSSTGGVSTEEEDEEEETDREERSRP